MSTKQTRERALGSGRRGSGWCVGGIFWGGLPIVWYIYVDPRKRVWFTKLLNERSFARVGVNVLKREGGVR